jgi:hypothetical protein
MSFYETNANKIANMCYEFYEKTFPKKLSSNEWTNLAAILVLNKMNETLKIVSICTGSKCLPEKQLSLNGVNFQNLILLLYNVSILIVS